MDFETVERTPNTNFIVCICLCETVSSRGKGGFSAYYVVDDMSLFFTAFYVIEMSPLPAVANGADQPLPMYAATPGYSQLDVFR